MHMVPSGHELVGRSSSNKLTKYLIGLRKTKYIGEIEETYMTALQDGMDTLDDETDLMNILDAGGDLGVGDYKDLSMEDLGNMLAVDTTGYKPFPSFESIVSDLGKDPGDLESNRLTYVDLMKRQPNVDKLDKSELKAAFDEWDKLLAENSYRRIWPRWHQMVGLVAMVRRFFDRKNVLLADGVGVGKTMQAITAMAYLRSCIMSGVKGRNVLPPMGECPLVFNRSQIDDVLTVRQSEKFPMRNGDGAHEGKMFCRRVRFLSWCRTS